MKNSKLPYILFAIGLFLIMGGSFSIYINGLKKDHANVEQMVKKYLKTMRSLMKMLFYLKMLEKVYILVF